MTQFAGWVGGLAAQPAAAVPTPEQQFYAEQLALVGLVQKLGLLFQAVSHKFVTKSSICLCQAWLAATSSAAGGGNGDTATGDFALYSPQPAIVGDPLFSALRLKSSQQPVKHSNSMPGKVWRSGAVQIVQNVRILPPSLHPRSQLTEEALELLSEALYIPIYDLARPHKGQVCILEVLLSSRSTETMLVAEFISFVGSVLTPLELSLSNPIPQPIKRSVLTGRRPRAPSADSDLEEEAAAAALAGPAGDGVAGVASPCEPRAADGGGADGACGSGAAAEGVDDPGPSGRALLLAPQHLQAAAMQVTAGASTTSAGTNYGATSPAALEHLSGAPAVHDFNGCPASTAAGSGGSAGDGARGAASQQVLHTAVAGACGSGHGANGAAAALGHSDAEDATSPDVQRRRKARRLDGQSSMPRNKSMAVFARSVPEGGGHP